MSNKEMRKLQRKAREEMQDKFDTLDDDNQAINTILNRVNSG